MRGMAPAKPAKPHKVGTTSSKTTPKSGQNKLAVQQRRSRFIEAYLSNGGNITHAAISAGFSAKSAASQGSVLLKNPKIAEEIAKRQAEELKKYRLTTDDFFRSLAQALHFDARKLYRENGTLKSVSELDDDTAAALAGLEIFEEFAGAGAKRALIGWTKKLKWLDKNAARDQLGKALRLYGDQPPAVQVNFVDVMRAARERSKRR